ncbi:MAG: hypothetical protein ACPG77_17770, partial [Nannocystaceae bacterium]
MNLAIRWLLLLSIAVGCEPNEGPAMTSAATDSSDPTSTGGPESETFGPETTETDTSPATTADPTTSSSATSGQSTGPETDTSDTTDTEGPMCNNGILEGDEECDDENVGPNSPCLPGCLINVCGDGQLNPGVESCDQGDQNGQYGVMCSSECQVEGAEFCGDGVLQPDQEDCEPGDVHDEFDAECEACFWSPYKIVFVSSIKFDGAMQNAELPNDGKSGLALADLHCQQLANTAGLEGTFFAWLSDNNGIPNHSNAAERIGGPGSTTSYQMRNGGMVAPSWEQLVANGPSKPIVLTEWGMMLDQTPADIWSNTSSNGDSLMSLACSSWGDNTLFAAGTTGRTLSGLMWTTTGDSYTCDELLHL